MPPTDSMPELCKKLPTVKETLDIVAHANKDWIKGQGATVEEKQIALRLRQIAESSDRRGYQL